MTEYVSATLGTIPESVYEAAYGLRSSSFNEFESKMKRFGYGYLRSGLLFLEIQKTTPDTLIGESIYNYLIKQEATKTQAINITRVLASSQTLINDIIEKGFRERDAAYGLDIKERLKSLGLVSRTIVAKAALEERITIYPILIIRPPPEIPPEEEIPPEIILRSQGTFTYSKGKKRVELRIWYQSRIPITEQELIDKWNEANDNATRLPNASLEGLLSSLEADPGFELNHEIQPNEIEGSLDEWYGVLIFTDIKTRSKYTYKVL